MSSSRNSDHAHPIQNDTDASEGQVQLQLSLQHVHSSAQLLSGSTAQRNQLWIGSEAYQFNGPLKAQTPRLPLSNNCQDGW
jgi:hypothetical protein